jgi:hypothetical protein
MDWIERLFHIAPDGGDGVTEALALVAVGLAIASAAVRRYTRRRT